MTHYTIDEAIQSLKTYTEHAQTLLKQVSKAKRNEQGHLRIALQGKNPQFFRIKETGDKKGEYLSKADMSTIQAMAQQEYNEKAKAILEQEIKLITRFLKGFSPNGIEHLYEKLHFIRKQLVTPAVPTKALAVTEWQARKYQRKPFASDAPELYTAKGERVRSKSEIIIADTLNRLNIPYRYEAPLAIKANGKNVTFHPDFTCLNKRTGNEFVWEHFGMMDSPEYAQKAVEKQQLYAGAGYFAGVNFIATFETSEIPLASKHVEQIAECYLK